jgi:single-strand DNA-binding protein
MSGTLNKVMLIGHLGDEVKMHYFEGGGCIGRFPLATNETYTSKQTNERVTNTEWHNIVVRNKGAEICEKYLSKGDKVWQDESGADRYSAEIHCTDFTFLSTKKESESNASNSAAAAQKPAASEPAKSAPKQSEAIAEEEDDLPF